MKTLNQLQLIKKVSTDIQNGVLNPIELNEAFKILHDEETSYLHNKHTKVNVIKRYMIFQYENDYNIATQLECLDDIFNEETYEDEVQGNSPKPDLQEDTTITNIPDDEVSVSPKKKGRKSKQTHKE